MMEQVDKNVIMNKEDNNKNRETKIKYENKMSTICRNNNKMMTVKKISTN
jgi:hypothetical protein